MTLSAGTRELLAVSFVTLSAGFAAGWWLARQEGGGGAPHAVGSAEHLELGTQALEAGDVTEAERHFREAAALDPDSPTAHSNLAATLMLQGRWEDARSELQTAHRLAPTSPEVWFLTGMMWRDGFGDTTRARRAWEQFLALVPADSPQAQTVRAWLAELGAAPPTAASGPSAP